MKRKDVKGAAVRSKSFDSFIVRLPLSSPLYELLKKSKGYDPKKTELNELRLEAYFHILRAAETEKEAFEIIKLSELYGVLEGDLLMRLREAKDKGSTLKDRDVDLMREMRQLLTEKYKLKHGDKRTELQVRMSYEDFRKELFKEDADGNDNGSGTGQEKPR